MASSTPLASLPEVSTELFEQLEERRLTYLFLASVYREEVTLSFLEALQRNPPQAEGRLGVFAAALKGADLAQLRIDLAGEYARILLAMSAHPVSPFESVYTSEKHLLMQDAYHQVIKEYARFCFVKADEFKLAADHIAIELEFMSLLIERSLSKLEAGDKEEAQVLLEEQQRFLTTHLLNWVYRFCEDFANAAHTDFYRGIAETTVACLDFDCEFFGLGETV